MLMVGVITRYPVPIQKFSQQLDLKLRMGVGGPVTALTARRVRHGVGVANLPVRSSAQV